MKILLGTHNGGKEKEALGILGSMGRIEVLTPRDHDFPEIAEDGKTYRENAYEKANGINEATGLPVLAEDAGLEVEALDGDPGIFSSRFAGEEAGDEQNNSKLLKLLEGKENRKARFISCALLFLPPGNHEDEEVLVTEGVLEGKIARKPRGEEGFGYDPLFIPEGFSKTLAELGSEIKDDISHRKEALEKMKEKIRRLID